MHQLRKGGGVEKASKAKVCFFLGLKRRGFKDLKKLFKDRISLGGDRKGGGNRAMRLKNRQRPKMKTKPIADILRGHPEEIITKNIESLKKTRHYWRRIPPRGGKRRRGAMRNGDGVQGG
jgi:hypothetical protein